MLPAGGECGTDSFHARLRQQLEAWNKANGITSNWFAIDALPPASADNATALLGTFRGFLEQARLFEPADEARPRLDGVNTTHLRVAIVADATVEHARRCSHLFAAFLRARPRGLLVGTTIATYGVMHLPVQPAAGDKEPLRRWLVELETLVRGRTRSLQPFDALLMVQDSNQDPRNTSGYAALSPRDRADLWVALIFHMTLGSSRQLDSLAHDAGGVYAGAGAAAAYFDRKQWQERLALCAEDRLLVRFTTRASAPDTARDQASLAAHVASTELNPKKLFERVVQAPGRPRFRFPDSAWAGAIDRRGKPLSPWWPFSRELYLRYFSTYLRLLPFRLSENAQVFVKGALQQFQEFVGDRRAEAWAGSDGRPAICSIPRDALAAMLQGLFGSARSIEQAALVLKAVREAADPAAADAALQSWAELRQLEVFQVPPFLQPYYDDVPELPTATDEQRSLDRLAECIRRHPLPGALLLRAVLLSLTCLWVAVPVARALSGTVVDLEWLLTRPWLLNSIAVALPLGVAGWRYWVGTLRPLRKAVFRYVALMLKTAQLAAQREGREAVVGILSRVQTSCDSLDRWRNVAKTLQAPAGDHEALPTTTFQKPVFEWGRGSAGPGVPGSTQVPDSLPAPPDAVSRLFPTEESLHALLIRALDDTRDGLRLCEAIAATMPLPEDWTGRTSDEAGHGEAALQADGAMLQLEMFCKALFPLDGIPSVERLLRRDVAQEMLARAFPAVRGQLGRLLFEWKAAEADSLPDLGEEVVRTPSPHGGLASLMGYRSLTSLAELATVAALGHAVAADDAAWLDQPTAVMAAALGQGYTASPSPRLICLDGREVELTADGRTQAQSIRDALELEAQAAPSDPAPDSAGGSTSKLKI